MSEANEVDGQNLSRNVECRYNLFTWKLANYNGKDVEVETSDTYVSVAEPSAAPKTAPFSRVSAYNLPTTRKAVISKFEKILTP